MCSTHNPFSGLTAEKDSLFILSDGFLGDMFHVYRHFIKTDEFVPTRAGSDRGGGSVV